MLHETILYHMDDLCQLKTMHIEKSQKYVNKEENIITLFYYVFKDFFSHLIK